MIALPTDHDRSMRIKGLPRRGQPRRKLVNRHDPASVTSSSSSRDAFRSRHCDLPDRQNKLELFLNEDKMLPDHAALAEISQHSPRYITLSKNLECSFLQSLISEGSCSSRIGLRGPPSQLSALTGHSILDKQRRSGGPSLAGLRLKVTHGRSKVVVPSQSLTERARSRRHMTSRCP